MLLFIIYKLQKIIVLTFNIDAKLLEQCR